MPVPSSRVAVRPDPPYYDHMSIPLSPDLIEQFAADLNPGLDVTALSAGSSTRVWWRCAQGHTWQTMPSNRSKGQGCPVCAGRSPQRARRRLADEFPQIAAEFAADLNPDTDLDSLSAGSSKRVWWRCAQGHTWQAQAADRAAGTGCPQCYGRICVSGTNDLVTTHPQVAAEFAADLNPGVDVSQVAATAHPQLWWRCAQGHEWQARVAARTNGRTGCPQCARTQRRTYQKVADRADLMDQWAGDLNERDPHTVNTGTEYMAWWRCAQGHEWQTQVRRKARGTGCPFCTGKRAIVGVNDLATTHPQIAAQWDARRNGELSAQDVGAGSNRKVWWRCMHRKAWQTTVQSRTRSFRRGQYVGNPYCPSCHKIAQTVA